MEYRLNVIAVHRIRPHTVEKTCAWSRFFFFFFPREEKNNSRVLHLCAVNSPNPLAKCWFSIKLCDFIKTAISVSRVFFRSVCGVFFKRGAIVSRWNKTRVSKYCASVQLFYTIPTDKARDLVKYRHYTRFRAQPSSVNRFRNFSW